MWLTSFEASLFGVLAMTAVSFLSAERPATAKGIARVTASAVAIAAASPGVRFRGGSVVSALSPYPPPGPGCAQMGTPASWSASRSRSTVRVVTSNRSASSQARTN